MTIEAGPGGRRFPDGRALDSVLRALDFVEERMGDPVGAADMARAACYSPFYFSRLFSAATGHAPYDYLMRRRVAAAAEEVAGGSRNLVDIAMDRGFEVPDTFARAFKRCFGLLPSEARRDAFFPRAIARTRIEADYVEEALLRPFAPPEPAEKPALTIVGAWPAGRENLVVARRDGELRPAALFVGSVVAQGEPGPLFPLAATRLAKARYARFPAGGEARLGFVLEYVYRAWLPSTGASRAPPYDLVELGEEGPVALLLPLDGE